jgi:hypothetical protein
MILGNFQKSSLRVHYLKAMYDNGRITFAMVTVVVAVDGFLLQKVLYHRKYLPIVVLVEVEGEVPCVIESDRLVGALGTDHS